MNIEIEKEISMYLENQSIPNECRNEDNQVSYLSVF